MKTVHPLQTNLWATFRENTGIKVVKSNEFIITIHRIPHVPYNIGYFPKGSNITQKMLNDLRIIGEREKCIFIQIEPNVEKGKEYKFKNLYKSAHPLFTRYTFVIDLTKPEEELLKNMSQKTRYNVRLAEKRGVKVTEDNSEEAFKDYLKLTNETTLRQKFYAHNQKYHEIMWETFKNTKNKDFTPHLLTARYNDKTLASWLLFETTDTLYYPYGASSEEHREVMASNLIMWEAIKFGKNLGLKKFDLWGAANTPNPGPDDIYYGFHKFKEGFGPKHVEFVGSFDYVINKNLYFLYKIANKIRWLILKLK